MDNELKSLTGLRGVAALYVVVYHFHPVTGNGPISAFFRHGYLAVDLFFVLSGFVMALNYGSMFRDGFSGKAYRKFLIRRIFRVYPLYLFITTCLAAGLLLGGAVPMSNVFAFFFVIVANTLMIQSWGIAPSIVSSAWSISTEWAAYLLFPLLVSILLYSRKSYVIAGSIASLASIVTLSLVDPSLVLGSQRERNGPLDLCAFDSIGPMVRCIAGFSLGLLAYRIRSIARVREILGCTPMSTTIGITVVALLCIPLSDTALAMLFPALIISLSFQRGLLSKILGTRAIYALGVWSYSIYLIHGPFTDLIRVLAANPVVHSIPGAATALTVVSMVTVVALSALAYSAIEEPARSQLKNILLRQRVSPNTETAHHQPLPLDDVRSGS
ncbi:acyltransferase family protein [Ralstonia soli]|uniref:Acyltransferase n=1 Tax=Ralstonia soli TaxID=2953896 RepID=A0ABT1AJE5_9RALS|nr:acyltransferase [Ralstonia soli]MCO5398542.1 acyltransferase [Ralstonia soli]